MIVLEMRDYLYLQLLLIPIIATRAQTLSCGLGEAFKPYNFTCNIPSLDLSYFWYKESYLVATCGKQICQVESAYHEIYTALYSDQTLVLNIVSVSRGSEGNYSCRSSQGIGHYCDFRIFARPKTVACQQPKHLGNHIMITGTVERIYPFPVCNFSWIRNSTEMIVPKSISYQNLSGHEQSEYFYTNCSLTLPLQTLGLGSHKFSVKAYPNVTGQTNDLVFGSNSNETSPVETSHPTVELESCEDRYFLEGENISCTCRETSNDFLFVDTSFSTGSNTVSSGARLTTYSFTANRNSGELICEAKLLNWTSVSKNYTAKVAYGPDNVSVEVMHNKMKATTIDWCDKTQPVVLVINCTAYNVIPDAVLEININRSGVSVNSFISSLLTYNVTSGGQFLVQCIGKNSLFNQVSLQKQAPIEVTEPPTFPPIIDTYQESNTQVTGPDNQLTVLEGMNRIRCRVEGGYPPVSNLSLDCGSKENSTVKNVVYLDFNVTRSMDFINCSCNTIHKSSCYKNKTTSKLDVLFKPTVVFYQVNENSSNITVNRSSEVRFFCEAEGNPSPVLSIRKNEVQLESYSNATKKFNLTLIFNKTMKNCTDTGAYFCQAQTGSRSTNKKVDVYVKCIQQLENSISNHTIYKEQANNTVNITIPVFGYPEPTNLHLKGDRHNLDNDTYNLTYISRGPPYGTVSLNVYTTEVTVFQHYTLNITNSEGSLIYNFQISEGEPEAVAPEVISDFNVGAVVGGIIAAIFVIAVALLIFICLKKRGIKVIGKSNKDAGTLLCKKIGNDESVDQGSANGSQAAVQRPDSKMYVVNNDQLYNMPPDEVIVDNTELYNLHQNPAEVTIDNSDLYYRGQNDPGAVGKNPDYKSYSEITPTITSATAAPKNVKNLKKQDISSPYEDIGNVAKQKPAIALKFKPDPPAKPGKLGQGNVPQAGKKTNAKKVEEIYSQVNKGPKSGTPFVVSENKDEPTPHSSSQPDMPTDRNMISENKKVKGSAYEDVDLNQDHNSHAYTNNGFSNTQDDVNVYSN